MSAAVGFRGRQQIEHLFEMFVEMIAAFRSDVARNLRVDARALSERFLDQALEAVSATGARARLMPGKSGG